MYELQEKVEENREKINHLIASRENITEKEKNEVFLGQFIAKKTRIAWANRRFV